MRSHVPPALLALLALLTSTPALPSSIPAREAVITVSSRPGVSQSFILMEPDHPPHYPPLAVIVAWPSGDGLLALTEAGIGHREAFFPRATERFVAAGLALVLADAPSDKPHGLDYDFRVGPEHILDIAAVVAAVRARINRPIFIAGFSRGTLSAAHGAIRLGPQVLAGVILASSVTVRTGIARRTLYDLPLANIRVPALLLHHRDDDCAITPPDGIPALLQAFTAAPRKDMRMFSHESAGRSAAGGCFAHTPHDFHGVEDQAVTAVAAWIEDLVAASRP